MNTYLESKILVVDDETAICDLLQVSLTREGYLVFTASDYESALRVMEAEKCQLVLIDRTLPDLDGYSLWQAIKSISPKSVAILLTGYLPEGDHEKWRLTGFHDFHLKPVSIRTLSQSVQDALHARCEFQGNCLKCSPPVKA